MRWKIVLQCETDAAEVATTELMTKEHGLTATF